MGACMRGWRLPRPRPGSRDLWWIGAAWDGRPIDRGGHRALNRDSISDLPFHMRGHTHPLATLQNVFNVAGGWSAIVAEGGFDIETAV